MTLDPKQFKPSIQPFMQLVASNDLVQSAFRHIIRSDRELGVAPELLKFHGIDHNLGVALMVVYLHGELGYTMHESPKYSLVELAIAALFHDYGHTGLPDRYWNSTTGEMGWVDSGNIDNAIVGFRRWAEGHTLADGQLDRIVKLIHSTRFPYVETIEYNHVEMSLLRDADLASAFLVNHPNAHGVSGSLFARSVDAALLGLTQEANLHVAPGTIAKPAQQIAVDCAQFWKDVRFRTPELSQVFEAERVKLVSAFNVRAAELSMQSDYWRAVRLEWLLHSRQAHPDYEYTFVESQRRGDSDPPRGLGWIHNPAKPMDRDDYTDTEYYYRTKTVAVKCPSGLNQLEHIVLPKLHLFQLVDLIQEHLPGRSKGCMKEMQIMSKGEYVYNVDEILGSNLPFEQYYYRDEPMEGSRPQTADQPFQFEDRSVRGREEYPYLHLKLDEWRIIVDLADIRGGTYVNYKDRGWLHWDDDLIDQGLPINTARLSELLANQWIN